MKAACVASVSSPSELSSRVCQSVSACQTVSLSPDIAPQRRSGRQLARHPVRRGHSPRPVMRPAAPLTAGRRAVTAAAWADSAEPSTAQVLVTQLPYKYGPGAGANLCYGKLGPFTHALKGGRTRRRLRRSRPLSIWRLSVTTSDEHAETARSKLNFHSFTRSFIHTCIHLSCSRFYSVDV